MQKSITIKLDRVFSEFIRLRDASANGYVRCISCGKIDHWKEVDCGHYVNRKHLSTRWNEKNCNAQCRACNRFDEGNMLGYTKGLVKKYGHSILDELDMLKHQVSKLSDFEGKILIKHYQDKVKELKKQKAA
jgi:hypothetical protein